MPSLPSNPHPTDPKLFDQDSLRFEMVTTCVGFDDILDVTLGYNHSQVDTAIIVTSHDDRKTQLVCKKYGATCVQTDAFKKDGRNFNKGAAIAVGQNYYRFYGWHAHIDVDCVLPQDFRRMFFNNTHLDRNFVYGADRVDVSSVDEIEQARKNPTHQYGFRISSGSSGPLSHRYADPIEGYVPIGFFQVWNATCDRPYVFSKGLASHDDVMFAAQWPRACRALLPTVVCLHLVTSPHQDGANWDGYRKTPRLDSTQAPAGIVSSQNIVASSVAKKG